MSKLLTLAALILTGAGLWSAARGPHGRAERGQRRWWE